MKSKAVGHGSLSEPHQIARVTPRMPPPQRKHRSQSCHAASWLRPDEFPVLWGLHDSPCGRCSHDGLGNPETREKVGLNLISVAFPYDIMSSREAAAVRSRLVLSKCL